MNKNNKDTLYFTVVMNDGSVLHNARLGFLNNENKFDWFDNKSELLDVINNKEDKRLIAFSTLHVQGKIIKQNIKNINVNIL